MSLSDKIQLATHCDCGANCTTGDIALAIKNILERLSKRNTRNGQFTASFIESVIKEEIGKDLL